MSLRIHAERLLLVEGKDEENLFNALMARCLGAETGIQVIAAGGVNRFPPNLGAIRIAARARPTLRSIGVVRDADDDADGAFRSVSTTFTTLGIRHRLPTAHSRTPCRQSASSSSRTGPNPELSSPCVDVPSRVRTPPNVSTSTWSVCDTTAPCIRETPTRASPMPISPPCATLWHGWVRGLKVACGISSLPRSRRSLSSFVTLPRRVPERATAALHHQVPGPTGRTAGEPRAGCGAAVP